MKKSIVLLSAIITAQIFSAEIMRGKSYYLKGPEGTLILVPFSLDARVAVAQSVHARPESDSLREPVKGLQYKEKSRFFRVLAEELIEHNILSPDAIITKDRYRRTIFSEDQKELMLQTFSTLPDKMVKDTIARKLAEFYRPASAQQSPKISHMHVAVEDYGEAPHSPGGYDLAETVLPLERNIPLLEREKSPEPIPSGPQYFEDSYLTPGAEPTPSPHENIVPKPTRKKAPYNRDPVKDNLYRKKYNEQMRFFRILAEELATHNILSPAIVAKYNSRHSKIFSAPQRKLMQQTFDALPENEVKAAIARKLAELRTPSSAQQPPKVNQAHAANPAATPEDGLSPLTSPQPEPDDWVGDFYRLPEAFLPTEENFDDIMASLDTDRPLVQDYHSGETALPGTKNAPARGKRLPDSTYNRLFFEMLQHQLAERGFAPAQNVGSIKDQLLTMVTAYHLLPEPVKSSIMEALNLAGVLRADRRLKVTPQELLARQNRKNERERAASRRMRDLKAQNK